MLIVTNIVCAELYQLILHEDNHNFFLIFSYIILDRRQLINIHLNISYIFSCFIFNFSFPSKS
jgi:hypothetical protein